MRRDAQSIEPCHDTRGPSAASSVTNFEDDGTSPAPPDTPTEPTRDRDEEDTATVLEDPTDLVEHEEAVQSDKTREGRSDKLNEPEKRGNRAWKWSKTVLHFLLDQWFVLGVGFVIVSTQYFPLDEFSLSQIC